MIDAIKSKHWLFRIISLAMVLFLSALIFLIILLKQDRIFHGIFVDGVELSNTTTDAAFDKIAQHLNSRYGNEQLSLRYGNNVWVIDLSDISYSFLVDKALEQAYRYGKDGSFIKRAITLLRLMATPVNIALECSFDNERLKKTLIGISELIDRESRNASVFFEGSEIRYKGHVTGMKLDVDKTMKTISEKLIQRDFGTIDIAVEVFEPEIAIDNIREIDGIVASYSTQFSTAAKNRAHNIKVACEKISTVVIMPGTVFSMDEALGPRTRENGYLEAPVIVKNELIDDIGGGICQVTTTLYNSALLAGMEIVERTHHSWPLDYVGAGRDATIAEGSIDFKFRNNTDYAFCINAFTRGGTLTIQIWGRTKEIKERYEIQTEVLGVYQQPEEEVIIDHTLPKGTIEIDVKGRNGLKVAVYRKKIDNEGNMLQKELVSIDYYRPVRQISRIGAKEEDGEEVENNVNTVTVE